MLSWQVRQAGTSRPPAHTPDDDEVIDLTSDPPGRSTRVPGVSTASAPLGSEGAFDEPAEGDEGHDRVTLDADSESLDQRDDGDDLDDLDDLAALDEAGSATDGTRGLGDELDAELEAEAAELAPLVELPDRPHFAADPTPGVSVPVADDRPERRTDGELEVRVRGLGTVRARRVRRVLRRVDPISVFKLSLAFNLCVLGMFLVAAVLLWSAAIGSGSTDNIESFVVDIGFEDFQLVGADLFRGFVVFGGGMVITFTVMAVLLALLFNLISDVLGGIRYTVIEPVEPAGEEYEGAAGK